MLLLLQDQIKIISNLTVRKLLEQFLEDKREGKENRKKVEKERKRNGKSTGKFCRKRRIKKKKSFKFNVILEIYPYRIQTK